ncbi:MAG: hypothetical protein Q9167_004593 [Letrouitia subvulpina]
MYGSRWGQRLVGEKVIEEKPSHVRLVFNAASTIANPCEMADPFSIAGLVLAVIGIIQGGRKLFARLWHGLKAAFGGLRSQSMSSKVEAPPDLENSDTSAGELISVDQSMLHRQLTVMMESDASLKYETARHYLPHANPLDPFGWSDDD